MNPSLRLRSALTPLAAFLVAITAGGSPLCADGSSFEIQSGSPLTSVVDDPDPTPKRRPVTDHERVVLYGQIEGTPSTLYTPLTRRPVAAWARKSATGFDVVVSRYHRGVWSAPVAVAASAADERDPQLVQDPGDGSVHLVYWIDGDAPVVVHQWAPADLSRWSAPELVSAPVERAVRPAACFHDGALRVAYESLGPAGGGDSRMIVLATRVGPGFTSEVVATTAHPAPSWPQVHSRGGRMWVDWIDAGGQMTWRAGRPDGGWEPLGREPFTNVQDRELARGRIGRRAAE